MEFHFKLVLLLLGLCLLFRRKINIDNKIDLESMKNERNVGFLPEQKPSNKFSVLHSFLFFG